MLFISICKNFRLKFLATTFKLINLKQVRLVHESLNKREWRKKNSLSEIQEKAAHWYDLGAALKE